MNETGHIPTTVTVNGGGQIGSRVTLQGQSVALNALRCVTKNGTQPYTGETNHGFAFRLLLIVVVVVGVTDQLGQFFTATFETIVRMS